jgi:hypothetical protein
MSTQSAAAAVRKLEKVCPDCGHAVPVTQFYKNRMAGDGYQTYCKRHQRERVARNRPKTIRHTLHEYEMALRWCRTQLLAYGRHTEHCTGQGVSGCDCGWDAVEGAARGMEAADG